MAVLAPAVDERAEWLAWRRHGVGGSDVAAILGISPWASPWSVWADKLALVPDQHPNEVMEAGHWLELAVGPWFENRTGLRVVAQQDRRVHPDHPVHRATIDGEVYDGVLALVRGDSVLGPGAVPLGGLEIKTAGPGRRWDEIPAHYQAQGQWQMHVCGWERVWFAVLMGRRLDVIELARDQADIDFMVDAVDRFWTGHVETGDPPPTDGHDATLRALALIYPEHTPDESVPIDDLAGVHAAWLQAKADRKAAEARERTHQAALAAALGTAEEGTVDGQRVVSWRTQKRRALDQQALATRMPRLTKRFTATTDVRVMRPHKPKPKKGTPR